MVSGLEAKLNKRRLDEAIAAREEAERQLEALKLDYLSSPSVSPTKQINKN